MSWVNYPEEIRDPYDLVKYELGGFEPCDYCGNEHPALVMDDRGRVGVYCMRCGCRATAPVYGRPVKGKGPPVKHGDYEIGDIRAARRWNNVRHWIKDGRPKDFKPYLWGDGVKGAGKVSEQ